MADTVNINWIYPPNWDGNPPDSQYDGWRTVIVQLTGISDGTGESEVTKVDISELRCSNGAVPTRTAVKVLEWDIKDIDSIHLEWDRAPRKTIQVLNGQGKRSARVVDASMAGDRTGDILLTSNGAAAGGSYLITLEIDLKED